MEFLKNIIEERLDFYTAYELAMSLKDADEVEIASILASLEAKGYDSEVVAGFAKAVRDSALKLDVDFDLIDTCGTGGDGRSSINVSTAIAIAISTQLLVAKHGNRSITSSSGSADVLEKLGIRIELNAEKAKRLLESTSFTFLFAPLYHKSFAKVGKVRRKMGIKTIFNVIGPLTNPANPKYQLIGVADRRLLEIMAESMDMLGIEGVVVSSEVDEVSPCGETEVVEIRNGRTDRFLVSPEDFGLKRVKITPCRSAEESARRIMAVFEGDGREEDKNFIAVNFAMAMYAAGRGNFDDNVELFFNLVEEGEVSEKLREVVEKCRYL